MKTLITLILLAFLPMAAHAQGAARAGSGPLRAAYSHVAVVVDGDVARTTLTQVFVNDLPQPVEASFSFPLPADATVTGFAEWRDGRKVDAKATGKDSVDIGCPIASISRKTSGEGRVGGGRSGSPSNRSGSRKCSRSRAMSLSI